MSLRAAPKIPWAFRSTEFLRVGGQCGPQRPFAASAFFCFCVLSTDRAKRSCLVSGVDLLKRGPTCPHFPQVGPFFSFFFWKFSPSGAPLLMSLRFGDSRQKTCELSMARWLIDWADIFIGGQTQLAAISFDSFSTDFISFCCVEHSLHVLLLLFYLSLPPFFPRWFLCVWGPSRVRVSYFPPPPPDYNLMNCVWITV